MNKPTISLSQMSPNKLYKNVDNKKFYRRLEANKLEAMENGQWKEVTITRDFLISGRFQSVSNDKKSN